MISSRPTVPLLVHDVSTEDIQLDLSKISANTATTNTTLDGIATDVGEIDANTASIKTSSANTATHLSNIEDNTSSLTSSVGLPADAASANTVIGLLKSISNKLTI